MRRSMTRLPQSASPMRQRTRRRLPPTRHGGAAGVGEGDDTATDAPAMELPGDGGHHRRRSVRRRAQLAGDAVVATGEPQQRRPGDDRRYSRSLRQRSCQGWSAGPREARTGTRPPVPALTARASRSAAPPMAPFSWRRMSSTGVRGGTPTLATRCGRARGQLTSTRTPPAEDVRSPWTSTSAATSSIWPGTRRLLRSRWR